MSALHEVAKIVAQQERQLAEAGLPIRVVQKGEQLGFAVHALNTHSNTFQPIGRFHVSYQLAAAEREDLLDLMEQERIEAGRPGESRREYQADAAFAVTLRGAS